MSTKIIKGVIPEPQKFVIYGPQGVGKSTIASLFPAPLFLDTEKGSRRLAVDRLEISTQADLNDALTAIKREPDFKDYRTVVIDTIDWLEAIAAEALCKEYKQESIESNDKGSPFSYGKGVVKLGERMMKILLEFDKLVSHGLNVVLLGHSIVRKVDMPDTSGSYDRYELDLNQKHVAPLVKHWCDALLFFNFKITTRETEAGFGQTKVEAVKVRERLLYCNHTAAADAKNRHGLRDEEPATIETIQRAFASVSAAWGSTPAAAPVVDVNNPTAKPEPAPKTAPQPLAQATPVSQTDGIPGIPPTNGGPDTDPLAVALEGHKEKALAWLRARGRITGEQTLKDVPADTRAKILANPVGFIATISKAGEVAKA